MLYIEIIDTDAERSNAVVHIGVCPRGKREGSAVVRKQMLIPFSACSGCGQKIGIHEKELNDFLDFFRPLEQKKTESQIEFDREFLSVTKDPLYNKLNKKYYV